jgi:hypothetical protein
MKTRQQGLDFAGAIAIAFGLAAAYLWLFAHPRCWFKQLAGICRSLAGGLLLLRFL